MSNIRERFEEKFGTFPEMASKHAVLIFFRQELLALAEEMERECFSYIDDSFYSAPSNHGYNRGLNNAATLIRSKADELN